MSIFDCSIKSFMQSYSKIKILLHQTLVEKIDAQIETISNKIESVHDSKANETKSSVGDKYETGRAMLHLEQEQLETQLGNTMVLQKQLKQLKDAPASDKISMGSLIETNKGIYYLAIGIGKVVLDSSSYFVISPNAPIGKLLVGKKMGDSIAFNENVINILGIY